MLKERKQKTLGQLTLLSACFLWGTSFLILDKTLDSLPVLFVLFVRFFTSALVLFAVFHRRCFHITKRTLFIGLALGATLATAYLLQTYGLKWENPIVTPGENAFLTSSYAVMVPFMCWLFFKKRPTVYSVIAAVLCVVGIAFINVTDSGLTIGPGQLLTLGAAVFFGLQILIISYYAEGQDRVAILALELLVVGVVCGAGCLFTEVGRVEFAFNGRIVLALLYLTFLCTLFAQGAQIAGMKHVDSSQAAIIFSFESVFAYVFSAIFGAERQITVFPLLGFALIFLSLIISETQFKFVKKLFRKRKGSPENGLPKAE